MKRSTHHLRTAALVACGFLGSIGILGFRAANSNEARPGLERYRATAISAVTKDAAAAPAFDDPKAGPISNTEVAVMLEARNVCREVHLLAASGGQDPGPVIDRLRNDALAARALDFGDGNPVNVDEFVTFAVSRIDAAGKAGSVEPLADFVRSECDPKLDYSQPILAEGK